MPAGGGMEEESNAAERLLFYLRGNGCMERSSQSVPLLLRFLCVVNCSGKAGK